MIPMQGLHALPRRRQIVRIVSLGAAMANDLATTGQGVETLHWDHFMALGAALSSMHRYTGAGTI